LRKDLHYSTQDIAEMDIEQYLFYCNLFTELDKKEEKDTKKHIADMKSKGRH